MNIKKTYRSWLEFKIIGSSYVKKNPLTDLASAIKKAIKNNYDMDELMLEKSFDINIDFCSVDKEGNIIKGADGKLVYKPEKLKEAKKKRSALLKEVVGIWPSICDNLPQTLTEDEIEMFAGIVISEEQAGLLCGNETKQIALNVSEQ